MKGRLSLLYFLQFAVWGSYLSSLGQFLGSAGLGRDIAWFYAAVGIVSILTPALLGHLADRTQRPVAMLGTCHLLASFFMLSLWHYSTLHPQMELGVAFPLYLLFLSFYMPTMALANTASFGILKSRGLEPVDAFPRIRVWGTVGFVAAMWMVNSTYYHDGTLGWTLTDSHPLARYRFQYNSMQLLCAGLLGIATSLFTLLLPRVKEPKGAASPSRPRLRIINPGALKSFLRMPEVRTFLIFAAFIGVCLQISNGFATPYISHFMGEDLYSSSFAAGNATMLFSLSQIAEACCLLFVGKALKRWGITWVFGLGMVAWGLRFLFFGYGNPGDGFIFLVLSMIVYGFAFNFITIAGHLNMDQVSVKENKGLGQGVMMLMSNGIGATAGTLVAGEIINHWCRWETVPSAMGEPMRLFMGNWQGPWMIFAGYSLLLALVWISCSLSRKFSSRNASTWLRSSSMRSERRSLRAER